MRSRSTVLALMSMLLVAGPALAQMVGTPSTGPLYPGGPRQGIGPPSITDSVPDIRLRQDGGGIPGAGPPMDYGRPSGAPSYGQPAVGARGTYGLSRPRQVAVRHCETPRLTCRLRRAALLGDDCSCRSRGKAVRGYAVP
ncbi:MAG TPA: hypothetical protein VGN82_15005 [Bosea sp. (in: a-proteobacteria)]|jgi:hypothetical protein|uniref:hypothetical protein n=1 Tax=Bosea sp. (in: a-proteobacteria) TaxID=1871050 RepID=UPI002E11C17B|nr:hypothetical protein [Bosea sp. (in: a-proteobacteria)]